MLKINFLILILLFMVLLSIAFLTLFERKFLGYLQVRKGPAKVSVSGLLQPLSDGVKLFMKSGNSIFISNKFLFYMFPFMMLLMMFMYWMIFIFDSLVSFSFSLVYFMMVSSISVYGVLGSGWVSNSKYAIIGAYRSVAQVVSYEVGMVFLMMIFVMFSMNYSINSVFLMNNFSHLKFFGFLLVWFIWIVVIMAELNRAPFDFAESESELVSGFNLEFGGVKFAFMFLGEYGNILFMSYLTMGMFHSFSLYYLLMYLIILILVRGVYPRFRYDNLMYLNWKIYLPLIMVLYLFLFMFKYSMLC